jgi:arylsulfatase A-like enzyme
LDGEIGMQIKLHHWGIIGLCAWMLLGSAAPAAERRPPNIIVMLLDNVGRDWFGCYGSIEGATPEIDRLASQGLRFEHCYATPFCSVTRVELLTGRYPFSSGWTIHHDAAIYAGGNFDALRLPTFANVVRTAGYTTAIVGKWQISNLFESSQADALSRAGFDEQCVWPEGMPGHEANYKRYWDAYIVQQGKRLNTKGRFGPDVFHEFAVDFIRRHREQPFLLYYPSVLTHGPHVPVPPKQPDAAVSAARPSKQQQRDLFAGMIRYADQDVGRLARALKELGVLDNTILIITSDNGNTDALAGRTQPPGPAGGGYTLAEGGIDMPLIVYAPGLISPAGQISRRLVDFTDFFPTLVELSRAKQPADLKLDGRSFAGALLGRPEPSSEKPWIASQYAAARVVRDQRYKLYSTGELFDIASDPGEKHDLSSDSTPAIAAEHAKLKAALAALPSDASLPFLPRSQSAYKLRGEKPPATRPAE